jgi:hypothetical protein
MLSPLQYLPLSNMERGSGGEVYGGRVNGFILEGICRLDPPLQKNTLCIFAPLRPCVPPFVLSAFCVLRPCVPPFMHHVPRTLHPKTHTLLASHPSPRTVA